MNTISNWSWDVLIRYFEKIFAVISGFIFSSWENLAEKHLINSLLLARLFTRIRSKLCNLNSPIQCNEKFVSLLLNHHLSGTWRKNLFSRSWIRSDIMHKSTIYCTNLPETDRWLLSSCLFKLDNTQLKISISFLEAHFGCGYYPLYNYELR